MVEEKMIMIEEGIGEEEEAKTLDSMVCVSSVEHMDIVHMDVRRVEMMGIAKMRKHMLLKQ